MARVRPKAAFMELPGQPRVLSRTTGPACSNICSFQVHSVPGQTFCAYAVNDGTVVVQQSMPVVAATAIAGSFSSGVASSSSAASSSYGGSFATVLLIDELSLEAADESFELLAWGGGSSFLLAAASRQHVYFFSLRAFFINEAPGLSPSAASPLQPPLALPSRSYKLLATHRLSHPLVAVDWTQRAGGLLVTDTSCHISMLEVRCCTHDGHDMGFVGSPRGGTLQALRSSHTGGAFYGDGDGDEVASAAIVEVWRVKANGVHLLAAAGTRPHSPCATTANDASHAVTVWWPPPPPSLQGEGSERGGWGQTESVANASSWRSASFSSRIPAAAPPGGPSPALMTVGADWVVRIWVEVVMLGMLPVAPSGEAPSGAAHLTSQFCLTLVVEPPALTLVPRTRPGLRACWAQPLVPARHASGGGAGGGGGMGFQAMTSRVQWIVATIGEERTGALEESVCVWAIDGLSSVVLSALPNAAVVSSRPAPPRAVLWGCSNAKRSALNWMQPSLLLEQYSSGAPTMSGIRAVVSYPNFVPVIQASDFFVAPAASYGEVRSFEVATGSAQAHAASATPKTTIVVSQACRHAVTGAPDPLAGLMGHPSGLASGVSLDMAGSVGFWCLKPVEELPASSYSFVGRTPAGRSTASEVERSWASAAAAADAAGALLGPDACFNALAWLSVTMQLAGYADSDAGGTRGSDTLTATQPSPRPSFSGQSHAASPQLSPRLSPQPSPTASPQAQQQWQDSSSRSQMRVGQRGGVPPLLRGPVGWLACSTSDDHLVIFTLQLPDLKDGWDTKRPAGGLSSSSSGGGIGGRSWGVGVMGCALRLPLPAGLGCVRHLFEMSATPDCPSGASSSPHSNGEPQPWRCVLVGVAEVMPPSWAGSISNGRPGSNTGAQLSSKQHAWVAWELELNRSAGVTSGHDAPVFRVVAQASVQISDALRGSHDSTGGGGTTGGDARAGDAAPAPPSDSATVMCCHSPGAGSGRLITGNSRGDLHFWRVPPGSLLPELQHTCRCDVPAAVGTHVTAGEMAAVAGGTVIAAALHGATGFAAAATTFGHGEFDDALHIWREVPASITVSPEAVQSASQTVQYQLDAVLPLRDTVTAVSWLQHGGLSPLLLVGLASGQYVQYTRCRGGRWLEVAELLGSGTSCPGHLTELEGGTALVLSGNHIVALSNVIEAPGVPPATSVASLAAHLSGAGLPSYHPTHLRALVRHGRLGPACAVLRALAGRLRYLRERDSSSSSSDYGVSAVAARSAAPLTGGPSSSPDGGEGLDNAGGTRDMPASGVAPSVTQLFTGSDSLMESVGIAAISTAGFQEAVGAAAGAGGTPRNLAGESATAFASSPSAAPSPPVAAPKQSASTWLASAGSGSAFESGTLDLSAFGMGGGGYASPSSLSSIPPASSTSSRMQQQPSPPSRRPAAPVPLDSGLLDMSAFGMSEETSAGPPPPPTVSSSRPSTAAASSRPTTASAAAPSSSSRPLAMDSGLLDMSAFGMGDNGGSGPPSPPPSASSTRPPASRSVPSLSPASTGATSPPLAAPSQPTPPQRPAMPKVSSGFLAMDSGMLDMSAFGMGDSGTDQPSPPVSSGQLQLASHGTAAVAAAGAPPTPALPVDLPRPNVEAPAVSLSPTVSQPQASTSRSQQAPADSGMLDMGAFGFDVTVPDGDDDNAAPSPYGPYSTAGTSPYAIGSTSPYDARATSSTGPYNTRSTSAGSGGTAGAAVQPPPAAPSSPPPAPPPLAASASSAVRSPALRSLVFPRLPVPAPPDVSLLSQQLLSQEEVAELHDLLLLPPPAEHRRSQLQSASSRLAGAASVSIVAHAYSGPSYLSDEAAAAAERAAQVSHLHASLNMQDEDVSALAELARALSQYSLSDLAELEAGITSSALFRGGRDTSSSRSPSTSAPSSQHALTSDVMASLDCPARVFLATLRLACEQGGGGGAGGTAGGTAAAGGLSRPGSQTDFAAALARTFRPVTVNRSESSPGGGNMPSGLGVPSSSRRTGTISTSTSGGGPHAGVSMRPAKSAVDRGARNRPSTKSVLSMSSLDEDGGFGGGGGGGQDASTSGLPASWAGYLGFLPGLDMSTMLWAQGSATASRLMDAALPHVPRQAEDDAADGPASAFSSAVSSDRGAVTWPRLRRLGVGLWLGAHPDAEDPKRGTAGRPLQQAGQPLQTAGHQALSEQPSMDALRAVAEALARAQYASRKDPHACCLLYLAIGKRALLTSLFKQSNNGKIADFLGRNFSHDDARSSAAKNAFALLGQHRYQLAASFFILSGNMHDAIGVLAHECRDPQLALLVARLLEGQGGPVARRLVDQELLPLATAAHDAPAASTLLWASGRPQEAMQQLALQRVPRALSPADPQHVPAASNGNSGVGSSSRSGGSSSGSSSTVALHFLMRSGVHQLSGRCVPAVFPAGLISFVVSCVLELENAGVPALAVEALMSAVLLIGAAGTVPHGAAHGSGQYSAGLPAGDVGAGSSERRGATAADVTAAAANVLASGDVCLRRLYVRLMAASFAHLLSATTESPQVDWRSDVQRQLDALPPPHSALSPAVLESLEAHWHALQPMTHQTLLAPWAARLAVVGGTTGEGSTHGPGGSTDAQQMSPTELAARHEAWRATTRRSDGTGGPRGSSGGGGEYLLPPRDVMLLENDRGRAVAVCSRPAKPGAGPDSYLVAVATGRSGLIHGELHASAASAPASHHSRTTPGRPSPGGGAGGRPSDSGGHQREQVGGQNNGGSGLFLGLMQSVLDHVRWTPDPWASMTGEFSSRSHNVPFAGFANSANVQALALASHPERDFFLSGSQSGQIFLWRFGEEQSKAIYVPTLEPSSTSASGGGGGLGLLGRSNSTNTLEFGNAPHWGVATRIRYSRAGSRFCGVGEGGLVALWRQDVLSSRSGLGHADWVHQCLHKQGADVAFLGDTGSQFLACGAGERGSGAVSWWDTLAPPGHGMAAGELKGRKHPLTAMALVHGAAGHRVVLGDEAGELCGVDLRMFGARAPLWSLPRLHNGPISALSCWTGHAAGSSTVPVQDLVVTAGRDGNVVLVDTVAGRIIQTVDRAHYTAKRPPGAAPPPSARAPVGATAAAVTGVTCCPDGVLTCGADGAVRFHALAGA